MTTKPELSAEEREKELTARLQAMEQQLERLSTRLADGDASGAANIGAESASPAKVSDYPPEDIGDVTEEVLGWASRNSVLPRLATLCFLLVVALILRTITDGGLVNKLVGSVLGMSYAAFLMMAGWYKYRSQSPLAPILAASGAVLMSTIVVETHTHFNSLPVVPAYLTLMATGIGMALISHQFKAITPVSVGILGMCFAGAAMDYPRPFFPYLALVLFTANLLGYFAAKLKRCSWLRWLTLLITMVMLQLWGVQIVTTLRKGEAVPPELAVAWFLPAIAVFAATYIILGMLGNFKSGSEKMSRFDAALPTVNVIWTFSLAMYVFAALGGNEQTLGVIGILIATYYFVVTFWLGRQAAEGAPGAGSLAFACGVLLALALPATTGMFALSLPLISMVALSLAVMSRKWGSGSIRLITYLFQIYCCAALIISFRGDSPVAMNPINIIPAGLLSGIILYQYQWCRSWPPREGFFFFSRFDKHDRSAVVLLLSGLTSGFFMLRIALFQAMPMLPAEMQKDAFQCTQSVLINCAAIALILFAFLRKNKEIRNVAIFVTIIGGIKVFLYDLMGTHGLPLVFSVFSFGMAAAIESIALGKWPKKPVGNVVAEKMEESA